MLVVGMNFLEIHALLEEVFACSFLEPSSFDDNILINPSIPFDHEGWQLRVKQTLVDAKVLDCLRLIAEKYGLKVDDTLKDGYYIIYSK
jgi:hypothetical protein